MSDFLIVLSVAILGLLAQAAGGKRIRNLAYIEADPQKERLPSATQRVGTPFSPQNPTIYPSDTKGVEPLAQPVSEVIKSDEALSSAQSLEKPSEVVGTPAAQPEQPAESVGAVEAQAEQPAEVAGVAEAQAEQPAEVVGSEALADQSAAVVGSGEALADKPVEVVGVTEAPVERSKIDAGESPAHPSSEPLGHGTAEAPAPTPELKPPPLVEGGLPQAPSSQSREPFIVTSRKPGIEYFLRATIFLWFLGLALYFFIATSGFGQNELQPIDPWVLQVTFISCALTGFSLVKSFRTFLSYILSSVECLFDWSLLKASMKNWDAFKSAFAANRVFIPSSIPHMVGLFIYIQTVYYLLAAMSPKLDFQMPAMPIPLPLPLDQLFSYNGLGLIMLAFCGSGIFVTRNFKEVLQRLALVRPTPPQIMIGLSLVVMSFFYDYLWSLYTHGAQLGLDTKLSGYNGGTFTADGGFTGALILALATALFAGVGEETLVRGALQPVFGLVPAAILHGVLHAQFQHAPVFIVQVAGWSILMGIVKRYTNTTTTIIGHAGFNFVTSFLFAFNP